MTKSSGSNSTDRPWYEDGLCFSCTQCGDCCRHEEGYVWTTSREVRAIARHLGLAEEEFRQRYTRRVGRRTSLIEKPNLDCVFWDQGCTIYPVRPAQCRVFPFWPENIETREDWDEMAAECPGTNQGRRYDVSEIQRLARGEGETGIG